MGQSAARKKTILTISYLKHKIQILIANIFQESKVFHQTMFATLHITPRRHICLTEAIIFSSASNFFTTIASLCNNIMTSKQKFNNVYIFLSASFTLRDPSKNTGFVQQVQNVMSVCYNWLINFNPCCLPAFQFWLTTSTLTMYCYFPVIWLVNFV